MAVFREKFIDGALSQGVDEATATTVFDQLAGFASYGFCKSHAAAFARTAYDTLYLRAHYPAEYYCALLNNQPMGFYPPRVVVGDAKRHGAEVLPVHANLSEERCTLEEACPEVRGSRARRTDGQRIRAIRLGLTYVDGYGEAAIERVLEARGASGPFTGLEDFCRRTRLPRRLVENLILAGSMDEWARDGRDARDRRRRGGLDRPQTDAGQPPPDRRRLIWQLGRLRYQEVELGLTLPDDGVVLEPMTYGEALRAEMWITGLAAHGHLMDLFRERLDRFGVITSETLRKTRSGGKTRIAGCVVIRQAPPTAKGFVFLTLEDEWGLMNIIIRPDVFAAQRDVWSRSVILVAQGIVERAHGQINLMATRAWRVG